MKMDEAMEEFAPYVQPVEIISVNCQENLVEPPSHRLPSFMATYSCRIGSDPSPWSGSQRLGIFPSLTGIVEFYP